MIVMRVVRGVGAAALLVVAAGCEDLAVENPNAPDNRRILSDPSAVEAVAAGSLRTWFNTWEGLRGMGPLTTQARTYSSSWNNAHMNFYSSVDNPGNPAAEGYNPTATWNRNTRSWQNDPARDERVEIEWFWSGGNNEWIGDVWPGFFAGLSSASDALRAIRIDKLTIGNVANTKRAETVAMLGRGLAVMAIALNYDKGYVLDENTDLTTAAAVAALQYSNRKEMRDAAVAAFQAVIDTATKYSFTTDASWMNGRTYTSDQIKRFASTMAALTLAYYPRDAAENAQVAWTQVASYASGGMSTGTPFDLVAVGDGCIAWCPEVLGWFDDLAGGRVSTRVAYLMDPATQADPWPLSGNPRPNSPDKRLGDGSFGTGTLTGGRATPPKTSAAGTDFAWSPVVIMRPDRGQYHQSNIGQIRYDESGNQDGDGIIGAFGPAPAISAIQNDLTWAEALLRQSTPNAGLAATLIDRTRVTRGGLPSAATAVGVGTDADGPCTSTGVKAKDGLPCSLWSMLLYEKEVELLGLGPSPFYEQRRLPFIATCGNTAPCNGRHVAGLLPGTPREMPVPAKELEVKGEPLYTYGGTNASKSTPP
jgi:hypothetical protein